MNSKKRPDFGISGLKFGQFVTAVSLAASCVVSAQEAYPTQLIRFVVPYTAGGPADALARAIAQPLAKALNTTLVVDNRGGAGGTLGTGLLAKAPPDGYTIGLVTAGSMSINPFLYGKLPYDPRKDFEFISPVASYVNAVVCHPKVPANNMAELIRYAKANPGEIRFGSGGVGTTAHLAMETVKHVSGAPIQHIAYRGAAQAVTDLIGGTISCMIDVLATTLPYVHSGKIKALAVSGAKRSPHAPEIPTMAESGLPGFEEASGQLWMGLAAPAGTPKPIIDKLNATVQQILREDPTVRKALEVQGFDPFPLSPVQFSQHLQKDYESWGRIVKATGAKAE
ncbi:Bug family tripartite tricarboxylate transporter substrate binding protein [Hydrogenophaga sp. BPS33]|uniref:Bug family tripartite tricarboxylate transporter substrate binding protein n=1 Tax=Hydrogenophaga sp. BPS33 TaxID=2651974 RepID=UPI00131F7470|nr:tripartite tricarboxylate transporter substrate binding protein [Hydrogenophaga sp. BPS33]QHE84757.1 tripartite tricarboxylate transporter substrate binding protein [Hydrogenophaga sp. BPS33]